MRSERSTTILPDAIIGILQKNISIQIDKAQRHIVRITLDCFKCLNVILYQKIEAFEKQTRNIDLTVIDNGLFYPKYSQLKVKAVKLVFEAKTAEGFDLDKSLNSYQEAYNIYSEIIDLINSVSEKVKWARARFSIKRYGNLAGYIISIVISALVSAYFSCEILRGCSSSHNGQTTVDSLSVIADTITSDSGLLK